MEPPELDDVDRAILHLLQQDARNNTASGIADEVGVAPNTVRNRISRLEAVGVIQGFYPEIDYERAGFQLHVIFVCTVPIGERRQLAERAHDVVGVIQTTEILSGHDNLAVEVVGDDGDDITRAATELEEFGITIREEWFLKNVHAQPFGHFGTDVVEE